MAVQAKARSSELYEQDLYAWSEVQADLLRRRRFAELDLEHVVDEIEDVGGSLYREVRSRVRTIMEHLLKLEHSAATEPRAGWGRTIRRERTDLAEDLTPSLRPRIERGLPRSRMAPHRLAPTKVCYRRHADRTEEMDMREIQDLTLQVERGMEAVDRRFKKREELFATAFEQFKGASGRTALGVRATLVPLTPIYIDRVHGNAAVRPPAHEMFCTTQGGHTYKLTLPMGYDTWRPIIRGSILRDRSKHYFDAREVHCDGVLEYRLLVREREGEQPLHLDMEFVMGMLCNALCAAEMFRQAAGTPDTEYGLEFAVATRGAGDLNVGNYGFHPLGDWLGPFPKGHTIFPRYSVGQREGFQSLAKAFEQDFWDAVGHEPSSLVEVHFERAFQELGLMANAST